LLPRTENRLKIFHLIDSGGLYGAETMLLSLMAEQVRLGLVPILGSIGNGEIAEKPVEAEAIRRGFTVRKFRFADGPNVRGAFEILRCCRTERADIIHSHGYKPNILLGFMPGIVRKVPMIATLHGWTGHSGGLKMRLYENLDAWSLRLMDEVVVVSDAMLAHPRLRGLGRRGRLRVVHNGIPAARENGAAGLDPSIVDFCNGRYTVGSLGRLSPEKGYDHLIEAMGLLRDEGMDVNLVIIGEGSERGFLEERARELGLEGRVLLPGFREDGRAYLPCFGTFVLSSFTEGLPMTLLEAMQAWVPIVATRVGGIPGVIESGREGILVAPGDARALAEAVAEIRKNKKSSEQMVSNAEAKVRELYSVEQMTNEYVRCYRKAIGSDQV
jgi:glycosyltransferase involved in cell wall biosynthesis